MSWNNSKKDETNTGKNMFLVHNPTISIRHVSEFFKNVNKYLMISLKRQMVLFIKFLKMVINTVNYSMVLSFKVLMPWWNKTLIFVVVKRMLMLSILQSNVSLDNTKRPWVSLLILPSVNHTFPVPGTLYNNQIKQTNKLKFLIVLVVLLWAVTMVKSQSITRLVLVWILPRKR